MIEKQGRIENARWVEGDLGVHWVYTAGVAGEEFLRALAKGKVLAGTCGRCSRTYCPPRLFCEECLSEIPARHAVPGTGAIASLTRLEVGVDGQPIEPQWVAAIRLDGTDSTLLHRVEGEALAIGTRVEPVWAPKRTGSILDIRHFQPESAPGKRQKAAQAEPEGNGRAQRGRRRTVAA